MDEVGTFLKGEATGVGWCCMMGMTEWEGEDVD